MNTTEQKRLLGIAGCVLSILAVFFLFDLYVRSGPQDTDRQPRVSEQETNKPLHRESGPITSHDKAPWSGASQRSERTIWEYVRRRAYPGAPPIIPHEVDPVERTTDQDCQSCHEEGGYSDRYEAFAPVTPHQRGVFQNCRQCHTPQRTEERFRPNDWKTVSPPETNQRDMPTAPPQIPHDLQNRSFCLSCHSGPGAVQSLRSSHPHLSNCRQCHQPKNTSETWERDQ